MSFVGSSTRGGVSSTQIVLQCPSGVQAGDFMFAAIFMRGVAAGISAPAGWTAIRSQATPDSNNLLIAYWKAASSSEPASYTWTASASGYHSATLTALRGPSGVAGSDGLGQLSSGTRGVDAPSVSASSGEGLICAWAVNQSGTVASWTPPSGMSETADSGSSYSTTSAATLTVGATGSTGVKTASYSGGNTSAQAAGMSVRLITNQAPNAPTLTGPANNATLDRSIVQRFTWAFSDPDTGDSQSKSDLRYSSDGGATWTTVTQTTPNQYWDAPAGTFAPAGFQWQVRTYDSQGVVGPWSSSSFFTAADAPAPATITAPTSGGTVPNTATLTWSAPNQTDYQWRRVADNAGAADTGTVYHDSGDVVDSTTRSVSVTFDTNNRYEHLQVRIKSGGLWSAWSDVRVLVSYTPPASPTVYAVGDDTTATIIVDITNPTPGAGQPTVSYNDLYVSAANVPEYRAATNLPVNGSWTYRPASGVTYTFRAVAVATNGTTASS